MSEKESAWKKIGKATGAILKSEATDLGESLADDLTANVKDFAFKNIDSGLYKVYKFVSNATQLLIYGNTNPSRSRSANGSTTTNYSKISSQKATSTTVTNTPNTTVVSAPAVKPVNAPTYVSSNRTPSDPLGLNAIFFEDRENAQLYLDEMVKAVDLYGQISVKQYFDLVGKPSNYAMTYYYWDNLDKAQVVRAFDGTFMIELPTPKHE